MAIDGRPVYNYAQFEYINYVTQLNVSHENYPPDAKLLLSRRVYEKLETKEIYYGH